MKRDQTDERVKVDVPFKKRESAEWHPKTSLGKKVQNKEVTNIDEILDSGQPIMEAEIVETLLPNLTSELLFIGQSKGKFGGGARRLFKQTQKKTPEGNKPSFSCFAVVGNGDGYVGTGVGKSKDTMPAREKSLRLAKLAVFKIKRGCGSWQCGCSTPHSIPFEVIGKCGSSIIKLMPAPKGKGLCVEGECAKMLKLAGIKDVWSKTYGQTKQKHNLLNACIKALHQLIAFKIAPDTEKKLGAVQGKIMAEVSE